MKILVLSPKPPWPPRDGGAVAIMRCIEGLAACGASITLLTMRTEKHGQEETASENISSYLDKYETVPVDTRIKPLKMLVNLFFSHEPYDLLRFKSARYYSALRAMLGDEKYDLIHCEGLLFSFYADTIRSLTRAPIVLRSHNLEHRLREMMADNEKNIFRKFYLKNLAARLKRLETEAPHKFDAIIPISKPDYQWFRSVSAGKPVMLSETGVIMNEFIPDDAGGNLKVGFIGALNWQPNIAGLKWFLAEVWPDVIEARPEVTLHIAGRSAPKRAVKQLKGKNVVFEGEVDDAARFTSMMTVMIAPLFAGSGLRIKIIEAMSHGKPVVATPAAAKGLAAADLRGIFICDDAGKFSDTLISLIDNPAMREAAGKAAKEVAMTRFDNRKLTANLYEFYKELSHDR